MAGRYDSNPFDEGDEVNPFAVSFYIFILALSFESQGKTTLFSPLITKVPIFMLLEEIICF